MTLHFLRNIIGFAGIIILCNSQMYYEDDDGAINIPELQLQLPTVINDFEFEQKQYFQEEELGYGIWYKNMSREDCNDVITFYVYSPSHLDIKHHIHHRVVHKELETCSEALEMHNKDNVPQKTSISDNVLNLVENKFRIVEYFYTDKNEQNIRTWILLTAMNGYFVKFRISLDVESRTDKQYEFEMLLNDICNIFPERIMTETELSQVQAEALHLRYTKRLLQTEEGYDEQYVEQHLHDMIVSVASIEFIPSEHELDDHLIEQMINFSMLVNEQEEKSDNKEDKTNIEKDTQSKLGPGGLDPSKVYRELPEKLREALHDQNTGKFLEILNSMDDEEADYWWKQGIDAGLWRPDDTEPDDSLIQWICDSIYGFISYVSDAVVGIFA